MPLYTYKAQGPEGKVVSDTIEASGKDNVATTIRAQGLEVLTINKVGGKGGLFEGGISVSEKSSFCRFLGTMLRSGMGLPEAVEIIRQESKSPKLQKVLADVSYQTKKGKSLSSVLAQYKSDFDAVFLTMVKVGEESGTLEKSLDYLAKQLSATHELSQKIKGSMMYPAVIVVAMFGNGIMMAVFVLPRIATAFLKLDVELPVYTRIMLNVGQFFGENTAAVLVASFAFVVGFFAMFILPFTRKIIVNAVSHAPVVKGVVKEIDVARYSRTLSTLLVSGVPIIESLDVAASSITHPGMKAEAKLFSESVSKGQSLSEIMAAKRKIFPVIMIQTVRAGEQSGSLEVVLSEVADFYEREVEFSLKRLTSLIEPVLMLTIGVVVGVMVIMMIAPIYSIIGGLQNSIQPGAK